MINLLPNETKRQIRAARANLSLIRYSFILAAAIIFLIIACVVIYISLMSTKSNAEAIISTGKTGNQSGVSVQTQATSIRNNLASAKTILNREILYSDILTGLATTLPSGAVVSNLNLTNATLGTPLSLKIHTNSTETALTLKNSFQASALFSNFELKSLASDNTGPNGYPVTVNVSLVINKAVSR